MNEELINISEIQFNQKNIPRRQGYTSFWNLILMLFRINKSNKKWKVKVNYTITLPVKWI